MIIVRFLFFIFFSCVALDALNILSLEGWSGVGIYVRNKEAATIRVFQSKDDLLIPFARVLNILECGVSYLIEEKRYKVLTAIGDVYFGKEEMQYLDGTGYIPLSLFSDKMHIKWRYDEEESSIFFYPPWRKCKPLKKPDIKPDVVPRKNQLSYILASVGFQNQSYRSANLEVRGRVLGGAFLLRGNFGDSRNLSRVFLSWIKIMKGKFFWVGNGPLTTDPLLKVSNFTGVRFVKTNLPTDFFLLEPDYLPVASSLYRRYQTLRGKAPPGSIVVLRVGKRVIGRTVARIDSTYTIDNIELPFWSVLDAEIAIFDPYNPAVPIKIEKVTLSASQYTLKKGEYLVSLGGGVEGDELLRVVRGDRRKESSEPTANLALRYGMSDKVTLETEVVYLDRKSEATVGATIEPFRGFFISGKGKIGERKGYFFQSLYHYKRFRLNGHYLHNGEEENFSFYSSVFFNNFETGLKGYTKIDGGIGFKPFVRLFGKGYSLLYTPIEGEYATYLTLYHRAHSLRVSYLDELNVNYSLNLKRFGLDASYLKSDFGDRFLIGVVGNFDKWRTNYSVRFGFGNGKYLTSYLRFYPTPGVIASLSATFNNGKWSVASSLSFGLSFFGKKVAPFEVASPIRLKSSITGRVVVKENGKLVGLENVRITVSSRYHALTREDGSFQIYQLDPGVYLVELDEETIPVNVRLIKKYFYVQVEKGSNSYVEFVCERVYGIVGRVLKEGEAMENIKVSLVLNDKIVQDTFTDKFGYFRFGDVVPGEYKLSVDYNNQKYVKDVKVKDNFVGGIVINVDDQ